MTEEKKIRSADGTELLKSSVQFVFEPEDIDVMRRVFVEHDDLERVDALDIGAAMNLAIREILATQMQSDQLSDHEFGGIIRLNMSVIYHCLAEGERRRKNNIASWVDVRDARRMDYRTLAMPERMDA